MIRLMYQNYETIMSVTDYYKLLQESNLPWFVSGDTLHLDVYVIGQSEDITIKGEFI